MFITFEGVDGCGKSTQSEMLKKYFKDRGISVYGTREPGGTVIGETLRKILLHTDEKINPLTEVYLYCAARSEHVEKILKEKILNGDVVICDRFYDSTIAYQGGGRELGIARMIEINSSFIDDFSPDITFLIDTPLDEIERRNCNKKLDRIEMEGIKFMEKVRRGYLEIAEIFKDRIVVLDGSLGKEKINKCIISKVEELLDA